MGVFNDILRMTADTVIQEEFFERDKTLNAFIIGDKMKVESASKDKKYGICFQMPRELFCNITETMFKWKPDGDETSFRVITTETMLNGKECVILVYFDHGFYTPVASLCNKYNAWLLEPNIAKKHLVALKKIKYVFGMDEKSYRDLMIDIDNAIKNKEVANG